MESTQPFYVPVSPRILNRQMISTVRKSLLGLRGQYFDPTLRFSFTSNKWPAFAKEADEQVGAGSEQVWRDSDHRCAQGTGGGWLAPAVAARNLLTRP